MRYLLINTINGSIETSGTIQEIHDYTRIDKTRLWWSYIQEVPIINEQYMVIGQGEKYEI